MMTTSILTNLYRLTSPSGKQYIGVTKKALTQRISNHLRCQTAIGRALRKYGQKSFRVDILVIGDEDYIYELEQQAIEIFRTQAPKGYNLKAGGQGARGVAIVKNRNEKCLRLD